MKWKQNKQLRTRPDLKSEVQRWSFLFLLTDSDVTLWFAVIKAFNLQLRYSYMQDIRDGSMSYLHTDHQVYLLECVDRWNHYFLCCWLFPCLQGFWENVQHSPLALFFFKVEISSCMLIPLFIPLFSPQWLSKLMTVAKCSLTSCMWAHFRIGSHMMPRQQHNQPTPTLLGCGCMHI